MKTLKNALKLIVKPIPVFFLFLLLAFVFAGCSKEETPEEATGKYFIKAKIDGQWVEFTAGDIVGGNIGPTTSNHGFGAWGNGSDQTITVIVEDKDPVIKKTYSGMEIHESYTLGVTIGYGIMQGETPLLYVTNPNNADSRLVISQLTEEEAKGTFSGTLIHPATLAEVKLTEGSFYIKLAKVY